MGLGALFIPRSSMFTRTLSLDEPWHAGDTVLKKELSDVALNAARGEGATYTDVRIGRYLNQFVVTREDKVQNIVNTESYGIGIRVIANGCWGFAATDHMDKDSIANAAKLAVAIAKENATVIDRTCTACPAKRIW